MIVKIRTCPFDTCPCELDCPDRHPDRSGCKLTDALDAGQDVIAFNNPTGEVMVFFHDTRALKMPAIIAGCSHEMLEKLLRQDATPIEHWRT